MKKHLLLIFFFIFATGCASINKINDSILNQGVRYKEPLTGKTANVRVFYGLGESIRIFPNSIKKEDIKNDKDKGDAFTSVKTSGMLGATKFEYTPKSLGMPNVPTNNLNYGEFKVPANRPILISMTYSYNNGARTEFCKTKIFKVQFEENKNYFLAINVNSGCSYLIEEYVGNIKVPLGNVEVL
ncbi:hypothetical protein KTH46_02730 [Acinetobacter bereziniae]|uniref:hypothetical protein n=1 Tax=Acinetobacter bereziniae TaxID=106648 RepID=UPI0021D294B1|nr:hypothetical protein [Acinetobacter bereziniae]MCU4313934.1 hypothetical protein [Acinetobacter bereziniae]